MAQILKEDTKEKIIESAKEEFLTKGYKNASLRVIAFKSHMTVGNLYRYFKNKEDLYRHIVSFPLDNIEKELLLLTNNEISFKTNSLNFVLDDKQMVDILDVLTDKIVDIYTSQKDEFLILLTDNEIYEKLTLWFSDIIKSLIVQNYKDIKAKKEFDIISKAYAISIFSGFKELISNKDIDQEKMKILIKIYFRSYVSMLNSDINKILESV